MSRTDEELDHPATAGTLRRGGPSLRNRLGFRGAAVAVAVVAAATAVVVALALLQRTPGEVELVDQATPPEEPEPTHDGEGAVPQRGAVGAGDPPPDPVGTDEPRAIEEPEAEPSPVAEPPPVAEPAPAAQPAAIEVRDERLYLLDAEGQVLRTLRDEHDGSQEYTLRNAALRPGSTTRDLAVAFVEGYMAGTLQVLVVRDGGEPEVAALTTVDYEQHDQQPVALPAGVWSPDGAVLAWLEPDAANRPVLHGRRWSGTGAAGDATPPGGLAVDPDGLLQADGTRGLELLGWHDGPAELLSARGYHPLEGGAERRYRITVTRADGRLQAAALARD